MTRKCDRRLRDDDSRAVFVRARSRAFTARAIERWVAVAGGRATAVALRAIGAEHLVDQAFGSDILDLWQNRRFFLFCVKSLANGVVDESHQTGRDKYAADCC
jgi:hypothetical protein